MIKTRQFFALFTSIICLTNLLDAQVLNGKSAQTYLPEAKLLRFEPYTQAPTYLALNEKANWQVKDAANWVKKALKLRQQDGLLKVNEHTDELGQRHQRFYQTYFGYSVEGSMYLIHSKGDRILSMNGDYFTGINIEPEAVISEAQALAQALSYTNAKVYEWQAIAAPADLPEEDRLLLTTPPKAQLVLAPIKGNFEQPVWRLAYKFNVFALEPLSRENVFVDAENGQVIYIQNLLHSSNVPGTAATKYSGTQPITTDSTGVGQYRLRRNATANLASVVTKNAQSSTNTNSAVDFTDTDNYWNNVNTDIDEAATDAHWAAERTFEYYKNTFNRNSIDNNGMPLRCFIHYDVGYYNAFWNGQQASFGDGNGAPLTGVDVVGHEFTHGVTGNSAQLMYSYESGALNESFSDIFGTAIEFHSKPLTANWLIGENSPPPSSAAMRSMENPQSLSQPDTYLKQFWAIGSGDNGGVHTNSGVQNYWYYLVCQGGSGTNDLGDTYNVTGIGMQKGSAIAYRNLTVYLTPTAQYADAAFYSKIAAYDLYGTCSPEAEAVINAWYAVGLGQPYQPNVVADFVAPVSEYCIAPATVTFDNTCINATSYVWDFGDGTATSTATFPSHTYNNYGTYTVTLIASDVNCGTDTTIKVAYVSVQASNPCVLNINDNSNPNMLTHCTGALYDSGGPNNNYMDNESYTVTIEPDNAYKVDLTFHDFNLMGGDKLTIYDGSSVSSPIIGVYDGTTLPNVTGFVSSTGGAITISMTTNDTQTGSGFEMEWKCSIPDTMPLAAFVVNSQTTCNGVVQFANNSQYVNVGYQWDFGDGTTSTIKHPAHTYINNGVYNVRLIAINTLGSDTLLQNAYITVNRPQVAPIAPVAICGTGTAQVIGQGNELHWFSQGGGEIAIGDTFNTPLLSTTTSYQVQDYIWNNIQNVGPASNTSVGGGGYLANDLRYPIFDVYQPCMLRSILVYAQAAGGCTFEYYDEFGVLKASKSVTLVQGQNRVYLNFNLQVGNNQYIKKTANSPSLYRNNTGASYPYTLANYVSITGNSANSANYYFYFYDWEVGDFPCTSNPQTVTVFAGTGTAPTSAFTYSTNNGLTYQFTNTSTGANGYIWDFGDGSYSTQTSPTHTYANAGTYNVTLTALKNGCGSDFTQTIMLASAENPLLQDALSIYPNPSEGIFTLTGTLKQAENVQLVVYNSLGEAVYHKTLNAQSAIHHEIDLANVTAGTYYLQTTIGTKSIGKVLVKR